MKLRPGAASYARVAYARELQGNLTGAVAAMTLAADATSPTDLEALAWTRSQLGDLYLQLGKWHEAKSAYAAASQAFPGHPFAVMGYAKAIAAEGDLHGALSLLNGLWEKSPTPDLAARIGELLERVGRHADAERQYALAEAGWRSDAPEPKNLARFLADTTARSLKRSRSPKRPRPSAATSSPRMRWRGPTSRAAGSPTPGAPSRWPFARGRATP